MVTTRPLAASDRGHLPRLACAAMSSEPHFAFLRPRHAQHTERSEQFYVRKQRMIEACPHVVVRVAVADDADPFTDLALREDHGSLRGTWEDGAWVGAESALPISDRQVGEGRILGYSIWQRMWPTDEQASQRAKACAPLIWPEDSSAKWIDRSLYAIMDRFWAIVNPDPSEDPDHIREFVEGGGEQVDRHLKDLLSQLNGTTGYIFCFAMAVDPSFQRRGIGDRMMQWGLERAEKEGAPIILTSTFKGSGLYEKLGFETLGVMSVDSGRVQEKTMVYWPRGHSARSRTA